MTIRSENEIKYIIGLLNTHYTIIDEIFKEEKEENGEESKIAEYLDGAGYDLEKVIMTLEEAVLLSKKQRGGGN